MRDADGGPQSSRFPKRYRFIESSRSEVIVHDLHRISIVYIFVYIRSMYLYAIIYLVAASCKLQHHAISIKIQIVNRS